ncbi:conserved hypothetical protein [Ricinus communis]|uniref:Uncharacterized protein n=1 Tax=Ricinus communis TaxID=3988 RepID=B9TDD4_RICCO|nr:conserved hypothetical protein [Ricinus communis]
MPSFTSRSNRVVLATLAVVLGIFLGLSGGYFLTNRSAIPSTLFGEAPPSLVIAFVFAMLTIATALLAYLGTGAQRETPNGDDESDNIQKRITDLEEIADTWKNTEVVSNDGETDLVEELANRIKLASATQVLDEIKETLSNQTLNSLRERSSRLYFSRTRSRLEAAIETLHLRANINLVVGIVITLTGGTLLFYAIATAPGDKSVTAFVSHYAPRLTLFIFIELLAYFFLRLYKANLEETKYYHNEITNVETRRLAIQQLAFTTGDKATSAAIEALLKTERNRILEKGQTTAEIEVARLDQATNSSIIKELAGLSSKLLAREEGKLHRRRPHTVVNNHYGYRYTERALRSWPPISRAPSGVTATAASSAALSEITCDGAFTHGV